MKGYLFIENSSKPTEEEANSKKDVKLDNVSYPCLVNALKMGYDVYYGVNRNNPESLNCNLPIHLYDSHTYRSITAIKDNIIAYHNAKDIVSKGNIEVIHCNTPIGGLIGRLVGKNYHIDKVIYTAHGFHFFKGAPLFNQTILKMAERIMAHWTDAIITMNEEDYQSALKFKLRKGGKVYKVHGVGINLDDFSDIQVDYKTKRAELGLKDTDIYGIAIEALAKIKNNNVHYLICGVGPEKDNLEKLAVENEIAERIHFLGFRSDVKELMKISDIFLFTTLQEGMPRSMMEAMASGLPCIASKIRGNVDLLDEGQGGYLREPSDLEGISECISSLLDNPNLREKMGKYNLEIIKSYDVKVVIREIERIYKEILG